MRIFILVILLIISFQSLTKADDIEDFEIEGISIGDSLIKYFSESYLNDAKRYDTTNTPWKNDEMFQLRTGKKDLILKFYFFKKMIKIFISMALMNN